MRRGAGCVLTVVSRNRIGMNLQSSLAIVLPLVVAVVAWGLNEYGKLEWEKQQQKEERYRGVMEAIGGFYGGEDTVDDVSFETFTKEWRLAWIYCPDDVARAGNDFLGATIQASKLALDAAVDARPEKERSDELEIANQLVKAKLDKFLLEIRRDVQRGTKLTGDDYWPTRT